MSNDNVFERLWKLGASANKLVLDGKREPQALVDILQEFVFGKKLPDINWKRTYEVLGMSTEAVETFNAMKVNPSLWSVPVVKGVTCNMMVDTLREAVRRDGMKVYTYVDDLEKGVPTNDRDPNRDGSYIVNFRRTVEADEENANKSANMLKAENHKGITLLERLLLGLGYFLTTGQHLDVKNSTLCTGSRNSNGRVPRVGFSAGGGKVYVYCYDPGHTYSGLRSRSVVS